MARTEYTESRKAHMGFAVRGPINAMLQQNEIGVVRGRHGEAPEILTPARCGSDLRPARSAPPDGPAQVRFFSSFLFFSFSIFFQYFIFFLFSESKQF
jgi:hypothetical protein